MVDFTVGSLVRLQPGPRYALGLKPGMVGIVRDIEVSIKVYFPTVTDSIDSPSHWNQFTHEEFLELLVFGPRLPTAEEQYEMLRSRD